MLLSSNNKNELDEPTEPNPIPTYPVNLDYIDVIDHGHTILEIMEDKHSYISDYEEYTKFIEKYELKSRLTETDFEKNNYLVLSVRFNECSESIKGIISADVVDNKMKVVVGVELRCGLCTKAEHIFLLPIDKSDINPEYEIEYDYQYLNEVLCDPNISYKPIIYLYPEVDTEVTVKLKYPSKLMTTYPKYDSEWNVLAKPNGDLIDLKTNRNLYGLYWEGLNTSSNGVQEEGFVVKGEDSAEFLEEKLEILGLNDREANEFIVYWLPILEANEYNYIRFETMDEINKNMPLEISPQPDTVIRVLMEFKGLEEPIKVKEQQLTTPVRNGFTVVEWGGTKLN